MHSYSPLGCCGLVQEVGGDWVVHRPPAPPHTARHTACCLLYGYPRYRHYRHYRLYRGPTVQHQPGDRGPSLLLTLTVKTRAAGAGNHFISWNIGQLLSGEGD